MLDSVDEEKSEAGLQGVVTMQTLRGMLKRKRHWLPLVDEGTR